MIKKLLEVYDKKFVDYSLNDLCLSSLWIAYWLSMALGVELVLNGVTGTNMDATDKDSWHRSGVSIVVDYGTGVEYLKTPEGFITPRIKNNAKN